MLEVSLSGASMLLLFPLFTRKLGLWILRAFGLLLLWVASINSSRKS
jgi:hypothetical protein